jgi:hypothetical protein
VNFKSACSEASVWVNQLFQIKNCWILLPGAMAVLLVYAVHHFKICTWLLAKDFHEILALWLVSMSLAALLAKSVASRDSLVILLASLALVFLVRELHDTNLVLFGDSYSLNTKGLTNLLLIGVVLGAFAWREKLFKRMNRAMLLKISIFGVLWTYLFSQLIARRFFKGILPNEPLLHVPLEETAENAAHMFLLVVSFCCFYFLPNKKKDAR